MSSFTMFTPSLVGYQIGKIDSFNGLAPKTLVHFDIGLFTKFAPSPVGYQTGERIGSSSGLAPKTLAREGTARILVHSSFLKGLPKNIVFK